MNTLNIESENIMDGETRIVISYSTYSKITGVVYDDTKELYINYFHVDFDKRGQGIGSSLLQKIIFESINSHNIKKILLTDESENYRKENNIYLKHGFTYINDKDKSMTLNI